MTEYDVAESFYTESLNCFSQESVRNTINLGHNGLLMSYNNIGVCRLILGDMNGASNHFKQAITVAQKFNLLTSIDYVTVIRNMGRLFVLTGEHNNAMRYFLSSASIVFKYKYRDPLCGQLIKDISNITTNVKQKKIRRILKQLQALVQ